MVQTLNFNIYLFYNFFFFFGGGGGGQKDEIIKKWGLGRVWGYDEFLDI